MATRKRTTKPTKGGSSGFANPRHERSQEEQHDDAMRFLRREYYNAVLSLAQEVNNLVKDEGMDESDAIHQVVDGSYWVIYTHANFQVLMCSDHHDAYMEDFGDVPTEGRDGLNWAALAYAAMARDVSERIGAGDLEEAPRHRAARRGPVREARRLGMHSRRRR